MKRTLAIVGPTASGKTSFAIELAKRMNGEVISLDSRQIYKQMFIGTAQPSKEEMCGIKHHLIGCFDPSILISSGKYSRMVKEKISYIAEQKKKPIICGGAGLYYRALEKGIFKDSNTDLGIRKKLEKQYIENPKILYEMLQSIDTEYSKIVHINNRQRLIRALEIYELTGKIPSEHFQNQKLYKQDTIKLYTVYLKWKRQIINKRIEERTKIMFEQGWINEVESLLALQKIKNIKFPPLDSIGYKHIQAYLNGEINRKNMFEKIVFSTRQLARRQEKWFKKETVDLYIEMEYLDIKKSCEILHCILDELI
ncbi:MAG: tRNA (adenosine(37)-N6)-dimethylallyltransferase MiaA [Candidatus Marinimicrobia bacterium]|nr:tRNA (adenosine(37)-N6)-dimethylallyltransferase MiaA [Candidatus Neomarinimicrobiota bacterium]|tara:strand:- start:1090 stop:2022 length:933 start_codon:yes stop_codon:yes gene_type:complete